MYIETIYALYTSETDGERRSRNKMTYSIKIAIKHTFRAKVNKIKMKNENEQKIKQHIYKMVYETQNQSKINATHEKRVFNATVIIK